VPGTEKPRDGAAEGELGEGESRRNVVVAEEEVKKAEVVGTKMPMDGQGISEEDRRKDRSFQARSFTWKS